MILRRMLMTAAALGTGFVPALGLVAPAAAATVEGSFCGLNDRQVSQGYTCVENRVKVGSQSGLSREAGTCQDRDVFLVSWSIVSKNGKSNQRKDIDGGQVVGEWGEAYAAFNNGPVDNPSYSCRYGIVEYL